MTACWSGWVVSGQPFAPLDEVVEDGLGQGEIMADVGLGLSGLAAVEKKKTDRRERARDQQEAAEDRKTKAHECH